MMIDIKIQFVLFLNLQILFFHHCLRFGENKTIIDMGDAENSHDVMKEEGVEFDVVGKGL